MGEARAGGGRLDYLDIAKGIAILLVVLGHTYCSTNPPSMIVTPVSRFIYSFHMPLFFVAAGVTSHYSRRSRFDTLKKNFYGLLIPYLVFSLIYMPYDTQSFWRILYASGPTILGSGARCVHLWYLPCLFVARMIMYELLRFSVNCFGGASGDDGEAVGKSRSFFAGAMLVSFAIGFWLPKLAKGYPFSVDVAFVALGFIIFGYLIKDYLAEMDSKGVMVQMALFAAALTALCLGNRYGVPDDFAMSMYCSSYGSVFWCIFNGISGIVMVRALSSLIAKIDPSGCFACLRERAVWLGRNTMGVYLLHQPMNILFIMPWLEAVLCIQRSTFEGSLVMAAVITAISLVLAIVVNRVFPQLFGKF